MQRLSLGLCLFLLLAGGLSGAGAAGAAAQEVGALAIAKWICPPGLAGDEIDPAACTEAAADVEFFAANPGTDNVAFGGTGGDGLVSFPLDQFALSPEGSAVDVGEVLAANPYGEVTGYLVSCTRNGERLEFSYESGDVQPGGATLGIQFTVYAGDQIACEWYDSHASAQEPKEPTPTPAPDEDDEDDQDDTGGPITRLPSTGSGAHAARIAGVPTAGWLATAALIVLTAGLGVRRVVKPRI